MTRRHCTGNLYLENIGVRFRDLGTRILHAEGKTLAVLVCSNASGDQKLPLVVIGKSKNSRALKGVNMATQPLHTAPRKTDGWIPVPIYFQIGLITFLFQM